MPDQPAGWGCMKSVPCQDRESGSSIGSLTEHRQDVNFQDEGGGLGLLREPLNLFVGDNVIGSIVSIGDRSDIL